MVILLTNGEKTTEKVKGRRRRVCAEEGSKAD